MIGRVSRWLIPGILAYLVFLAAMFPAVYALRWAHPESRGLVLSGVSGSIWSGQAGQLVFQKVPLGAVNWHFDWLAPWTGKIGYRLELHDGPLQVHGRAAFGRGGQLEIHDLSGRVPVTRLNRWMPLPSDSVDGVLILNLADLVVSDNGLPQSANGSIDLTDATLHWPETAALGNYRMQVHTTKQGISGSIKDMGGPLNFQAQTVLSPSGHYSIQGQVSARDQSAAAAHLLTYMGTPGAGNRYPFNFGGQL